MHITVFFATADLPVNSQDPPFTNARFMVKDDSMGKNSEVNSSQGKNTAPLELAEDGTTCVFY